MIHSFQELSNDFKIGIEDYKFKPYVSVSKYNSLEDFLEYLCDTSIQGALARGYTHTIFPKDLLDLYTSQKGLCALSGLKLTRVRRTSKRISPYNISIDRIDNTKGYSKDNIQLVCSIINLMKNESTTKEFLNLCKAITNYNA